MKIRRWFPVLVTLALVLGIVAGCAPAGPVPTKPAEAPAAKEPIKIGGIGPLSPPGTPALGTEMMNAFKLRIDEINAAGGLLGRPLELVFEDSAGTPEKGTAAMEKLINKDKVIAVVGEGHSSALLAEMEVAHRSHVILIDVEAWSDKIRTRGYREVFAIPASNTLFNAKIAEFIQASGFKRPFLLAEDTDFGVEGIQLLGKALENLGITYESLVVDRTTKDFVPFLLQAQEFNPDILVVNVTGVGAYLIIKQAKELGLAPTANCALFSGVADMGYPELWETAGSAAQYVVWETAIHPKAQYTDLTQPFIDKYTKTYGRPPTYSGLQAYDAILVLEEAIKLAGSTDTDKLIEALEKVKVKGTRGIMSFPTEPGVYYHQADVPLLFLQYTEVGQTPDKCEIVFPVNLKTADLQKPPK
ncbi:MAG: ABC transporter substrate-binding protein [Chloroflexi bacterium]|nr:ABC transporter substrate-binding protein [Chloroflexota bacterium]